MSSSFYNRLGKRWFDAIASAAGLVILSPVLLGIAIAVKLTSPGPVFFRQARTGRFGKPFRIFKFRTMVEDAAEHGSSITSKGDSRITRLGRWLRNTKLDELPQLINVLVGQMSLVGPRPEIPKFTKGYSERFRRVLLVRPGITGRAANAYIREEELLEGCGEKERFYAAEVLPRKLELELPYCEDIRFATDVKLIAQTIGSIFAQETSSSPRYNENVFAK